MADPTAIESGEAAAEPSTAVEAPPAKKKTLRSRKAKAAPKAESRKNGADQGTSNGDASAATTERVGRKVHSPEERARKLAQVEKAARGGDTLKSAVKRAGISEQTYYLWKKAAAPAPTSDELTDLVTLEKENKRLKSLLAERLRKENADLKRKLGLH